MDELIVVVTMPGRAQPSARAFRGTVVVGRGDDCDLMLPHRLVSRRHAELARTDEGATVIRDLGSSNGTLVDGRELRDAEVTVHGEATVQIGPYSLLVSGEASSMEGTLMLAPDAVAAGLGALRGEDEAPRDEVTGLPNRRRFNDRLEEAIAEASAERRSLAVVNVNVNRLRYVNERYGYEQGDALLAEVGRRLESAFPDEFVAHLAGDSFGLVIRSRGPTAAVEAVFAGIESAMESPFALERDPVRVEVTTGIALFPGHGRDAASLLSRAESAVEQARRQTRGRAVYSRAMESEVERAPEVLAELRDAIREGQLLLHYQPKVEASTLRVEGVEALVRWDHPQRGLLGPAEFIPIAEESGLMAALSRWVIDEAVRALHGFGERGLDLSVAVNISARDLRERELPSWVALALDTWGADPGKLKVEVTETAVVDDPQAAGRVLREIRELGVSVSLDDFGVGQASLAHLRDLPIDEIKIDRTFVVKLSEGEADVAFVRAFVDLGRALGLVVTAEGVETAEQLETVARLGCDLVQGYYISRPLAESDFFEWLERRGPLEAASGP